MLADNSAALIVKEFTSGMRPFPGLSQDTDRNVCARMVIPIQIDATDSNN